MGYISMCCYEGSGVQVFKSRIGSSNQAPVVQMVDNAIHWMVIYPVDCSIQHLNNLGQRL